MISRFRVLQRELLRHFRSSRTKHCVPRAPPPRLTVRNPQPRPLRSDLWAVPLARNPHPDHCCLLIRRIVNLRHSITTEPARPTFYPTLTLCSVRKETCLARRKALFQIPPYHPHIALHSTISPDLTSTSTVLVRLQPPSASPYSQISTGTGFPRPWRALAASVAGADIASCR